MTSLINYVDSCIVSRSVRHEFFQLWLALKFQLLAAGLSRNNVTACTISELVSYQHSEHTWQIGIYGCTHYLLQLQFSFKSNIKRSLTFYVELALYQHL